MILTVCPDCEETVRKVVSLDDYGFLYWMCPYCGVIHLADRWVVRLCNKEELDAVLNNPESLGRYMFDTGIEVIGVENLDGNIVTEEFQSTVECLAWFVSRQEGFDDES